MVIARPPLGRPPGNNGHIKEALAAGRDDFRRSERAGGQPWTLRAVTLITASRPTRSTG